MSFLLEAAGPLAGLPRHWIKYLTDRYNAPSLGLAGEKSTAVKLKQFHPWQIKNALKDENNLAVIGRIDNQPLFMVAPHEGYKIKYRVFEVNPDYGNYKSMSDRYSRGDSDSFTISQVIDIVDQLTQDKTFENLTIESISKDPERDIKVEKRKKIKAQTEDPLKLGRKSYWGNEPSVQQRERAKKYKERKLPELEKKLKEVEKEFKDSLTKSFDESFKTIENDIKEGKTWTVRKEYIARKLLSSDIVIKLENLAKAYSILGDTYSNKDPMEIIKKLKDLNLGL